MSRQIDDLYDAVKAFADGLPYADGGPHLADAIGHLNDALDALSKAADALARNEAR